MVFGFELKRGKDDIPIDKIDIVKNIRSEIDTDDLSSLMMDIKHRGLLQPIALSLSTKENRYKLVYGHRRFVSMKNLGWEKVCVEDYKLTPPDLTPQQFIIYNMMENMHRREITPIEIGKHVQELRKLGMTIGEIAVEMSVTKSKCENFLRLYQRIPQRFEVHIGYVKGRANKKGKISAAVAQAILATRSNKEITDKLFEAAHRDDAIGVAQLRLIRTLIEQGMELDDAIRYSKTCHACLLTLAIRKDVEKELVHKHQLPITAILKKMLKGEINIDKLLVVD